MKMMFKNATVLMTVLISSFLLMACTDDDAAGGDPIEPEELGSGEVKWEETETEDGYVIVTNDDGKTLGYSKDSGVELLQVDGYAFKDLNNNGVLDPYEDWRLEADERAANLASLLSPEEIAGLMLYSSHVSSVSEELEEDQIEFLDIGGRAMLNAANSASTTDTVKWNNAMQAYAEATGYGIPVITSTDPREGGVSGIPSNLALAATFDSELVQEMGNLTSIEYRLLGIGTLLGPQIDIATEPRWNRVDGTFGEDPALARDLTSAFVHGVQSTFDEDGNDLGWGPYSLNTMIKHWPGDGAAEGGREGHSFRGNAQVYPGGQFDTHLIPFVDGGFNLDGETESTTSVMASYSIAFEEDETYGELVGTAFSEYKLNDLLRDQYGFDGVVTTDWSTVDDLEGGFMQGKPYGVSELTKPERILKAIQAGTDQFGGLNDRDVVIEAYELGAEELGEDVINERFEKSAERILNGFFTIGLFENPYVDLQEAELTVLSEDNQLKAYEAQLKSIVMLKNSNNAISSNDSDEKQTVYVPMIYVPYEVDYFGGVTEAEWTLPVDIELLEEHYNVVTDTPSETLTGPEDDDGNPTVAVEDIERASAGDLASVDFALPIITSPVNEGNYFAGFGYDQENEEYIPISLQYGEYTADSEHVRQESISGDITVTEQVSGYVVEEIEEKENRSYYGNTAIIKNYEDLNTVKYAAETVPEDVPVIVAIRADGPMIMSEIEPYADAILVAFGWSTGSGYGIEDEALLEIAAGKVEPSALLPVQMPANMETVEAQYEDVPRDMESFVDSEGNEYDFTFGLDWSGVIQDERTERYDVPALVTPDNTGSE
ncbi:glycoside hydrolase family 3 N-terminal domain-containing protein [Halalkalibacter sp. APA_J-10(15)]|uniref:glycoside hydrolase family 3 protein n=1 Tax=Halalkalibacter sp. APA_J-10(15) TaxID=2933805 RepID=UPI001FF53AE0|nr:glycoside hydrolase family 3 N-terminal domain-containing protein [Halalkalibacter sp. APA_J-10(15)]MCK0472299.1 glycoside hydrolase family 3 C-terminal domain-containing protein [Halalkalibacter sp. APA_J-10(15)]